MAIMRSKPSGGKPSWLGIKEAGILSFRDDSSKFDWADVYITVEFEVEDSDYTREMKVAGSFEKNADGTIKDCPLLKKITYLTTALGWDGGVNHKGQWVDNLEQPIPNIAEFLTSNFGTPVAPSKDYVIYVYREMAKNGKAYTRVHNKIMKKGNGAIDELDSYIKYLQSKGYIKEATAEQSMAAQTEVNIDGLDVASL